MLPSKSYEFTSLCTNPPGRSLRSISIIAHHKLPRIRFHRSNIIVHLCDCRYPSSIQTSTSSRFALLLWTNLRTGQSMHTERGYKSGRYVIYGKSIRVRKDNPRSQLLSSVLANQVTSRLLNGSPQLLGSHGQTADAISLVLIVGRNKCCFPTIAMTRPPGILRNAFRSSLRMFLAPL